MSTTVELAACYRLAPGVAIRPERFGGLAYRYDNRRLYFLHSHQAVEFVNRLDGSHSLQETLDEFLASQAMPQPVREMLVKAVDQLERLGLLTQAV
ncbi:MAG: mycofactocin biosynthesis chaperone MftB [Candidatus Competibacter sp.]